MPERGADDPVTVMTCATCGHTTRSTDLQCERCGTLATPESETLVPRSGPAVSDDDASPTLFAEATRLRTHLHQLDPSDTDTGAGGDRNAALPIATGRIVANRYRISKLVGVGGMGVVYKAWDDQLGIDVALKVILPNLDDPFVAMDLERRFRTELILSRQVTHKNVVRIHDLGDVDGIKYITMPYIDGVTLRRLIREKSLNVRRALQIARQIAAGLGAAHEAGVIHRDLKPDNVMVDSQDRALIMDFGIAQTITSKAQSDGAGVVGTLHYMAPEQADGKWVDQRADVYAFGLILYEMLTHFSRPVTHSVSEVREARRLPLPAVRALKPDVPKPLEAIVEKCLQYDPAARYESSVALHAALETLNGEGHLRPIGFRHPKAAVAAGLALATLAAGTSWMMARRSVPAPPPSAVSVLIADFENRAGVPAFDGAIEQALTVGVEGASFITAYPRRDAARLASKLVDGGRLDEAGARLVSLREGVKFVVSGAIETVGSGYTVTAHLIDPGVEKVVRTERMSAGTPESVLKAAGTIAARLRRDMGDTSPQSVAAEASETFTAASLAAVQHYTVAQDLQANNKFAESIERYRLALEADPNFGRALSGWANSAYQLGRKTEAEELWKRALARMDRMTERERYRTLGGYYILVARNYEQAIKNYSELVRLYPADRAGHSNLALAYFYTLDFAKALEEGRKAMEIYPSSQKFRGNYALYSMYASQFDEAASQARRLLEGDASFADAYFPLAISQLMAGDRSAARATYEAMAKMDAAAASRAAMGIADVAMAEGQYARAAGVLAPAIDVDRKSDNTEGLVSKSVALAEAYAALGRQADALQLVNRAADLLPQESVLFPAARIHVAGGDSTRALELAGQLDAQLQSQTRAYARIIEGEVALAEARFSEAIDAFRAASRLYDAWLSHFDLGIAYVRAGHFAEAVSEFDLCVRRRGEAASLFLDDVPSYRYMAALPYWHARAEEGVGMTVSATEKYKAFVELRGTSGDPLVVDARKRIAAAGKGSGT
ncbi:MAG: protein kinase [Vicinamibacterales bacterium]